MEKITQSLVDEMVTICTVMEMTGLSRQQIQQRVVREKMPKSFLLNNGKFVIRLWLKKDIEELAERIQKRKNKP